MELLLDPAEVRVLGSLLEKEITTPEYYPLTLNALVNACNQRSNRDPVAAYPEETVSHALATLREKGLATVVTGGSNRVPKYGHRITEKLNLGRRELALICELLIRGQQTLGELRDHADRMHQFTDLEKVGGCLRGLMDRELVTVLPRQAGMKEPRYAHLLSGPVEAQAPSRPPAPASGATDRLNAVEAEVAELRRKLQELESQWSEFRRQFE
ncbi:MAG: YceH family protein [Bryobacteraceae bacterium]